MAKRKTQPATVKGKSKKSKKSKEEPIFADEDIDHNNFTEISHILNKYNIIKCRVIHMLRNHVPGVANDLGIEQNMVVRKTVSKKVFVYNGAVEAVTGFFEKRQQVKQNILACRLAKGSSFMFRD